MYIYSTELFHNTTNATGVPASNAADLATFNTAGNKSSAMLVDDVEIAETTFEVSETFSEFSAHIDGSSVLWSNVKYTDNGTVYTLFLVSENQL